LDDLLESKKVTSNCIQLLNVYSPVLAKICLFIVQIKSLFANDRQDEIRDQAFDLLEKILQIARQTYTPAVGYQNNINELSIPLPNEHFQEVMDTGAFFPNRPIIRTLKTIQLSKEPKKCNKGYKKAGRLGAGTLLFWCAEHR
jgi:hypothetical protein